AGATMEAIVKQLGDVLLRRARPKPGFDERRVAEALQGATLRRRVAHRGDAGGTTTHQSSRSHGTAVVRLRRVPPSRGGCNNRLCLSDIRNRAAKDLVMTSRKAWALVTLLLHPEWTDQQIADAAQVSRRQLYRWREYGCLRALLRG